MQTSLRTDIQAELEQFVAHMEHDDIDSYAANCKNTGYTREGGGQDFFKHNEGDELICKLMSGALFFMNANSWTKRGGNMVVSNDDELKDYVRCAIVNIFMYILLASPCRSQMGVYYAWDTVTQMEGIMGGLITEGKCKRGVFTDIQTQEFDMEKQITTWLKNNPSLTEKIEGPAIKSKCTQRLQDLVSGTTGTHAMDDKIQLQTTQTHVIEDLRPETTVLVREVPPQLMQPAREHATSPNPDSPADASHDDDEDDGDEQEDVNGAAPKPGAAKPANSKTVQPTTGDQPSGTGTPPGQARADESAGEDPAVTPPGSPPSSQPQAPASPVLPPAPEGSAEGPSKEPPAAPAGHPQAPASANTNDAGTTSQTATTADGKQSQSTCVTHINDNKIHQTAEGNNAVSVGITIVDSSSTGCSGSGTPGEDPTKSNSVPEPPAAAQPAAEAPPTASEPAEPTETATGAAGGPADGTIQGTVAAVTPKNKGDDPPSAPSRGDHVVDGGNDDPPPLNPPKPKPNPNPNQSGSSGGISESGSSAAGGGAAGSGGGGASGSSSSSPSEPSSSGSAEISNPGSSGSASPSTPQTPQIPSTAQNDQPAQNKPGEGGVAGGGLRWEDVKPYIPAIIPAVVGIGIIAFFLWKYFAYLAKRRRTYRTVRDVPSPPLDEEILDHLQRGEPPPDYGYTMIRDTRPGRLPAARRRRQPRVNRRTIIELHLEVLNECEATEWQHVKEDYLQILVQEFMGGNNGHSSFPDAPTTKQGLSGSNVSSTDSDGKDPCPRNEDDPDPCSCMETIQLEPGPCRPHDPDAWSCMETIPLATDPSASNDEDYDPWSCMETIQLATDRCPPNEDDRWNCMETIQLQTGPCRPNAEDRWNCMETIQLDTAPDAHSSPRNECPIPDHTNWINWIDRHKHIVRACTGQPWFNALKSEWKQHLRDHMVANEDNGVYGHSEFVDKDVEVEKAMAAEHMLRVRDLPRSQLHQPPHMKKRLTAKTWILLLALVIEQCELERNLQETESYVDDLLDKL
ncbi:hypothetical protein AK88_05259 [Plasmodium fragile]|uniref:Schizont-infected cell agglutination C-terminal domain-containing protein n=1 Tax=Plasmodium fragile TaxID=5857 RepID=A0A0D9QE81_PLAFR|nr:uncharacterized protein AK88_05259 [Plasmodium fragile]KJP85107.1 hypothetical protein AK88_05259 [Plasmodium fragile]